MKGDEYMKVIVAARHMSTPDAAVEYAKDKLSKFEHYFNSELEAHLTFSYRGSTQIFEVTIPMKNGAVLRGEASSDEVREAVDKVVDIIGRQVRKHKTKLQKHYRENKSIRYENIEDFDENEEENKIVKSKRFGIKPMSPEEAVLQMNLVNHDFFVFLNANTEEVNVVYTRKDGDYGLIEPYI